MRISDWSSDLCSSDLSTPGILSVKNSTSASTPDTTITHGDCATVSAGGRSSQPNQPAMPIDRKSVVEGKRVSVRVDVGGRRSIKKKKQQETTTSHNMLRSQIPNHIRSVMNRIM